MRILVPTDFSPTAERALHFAAQMASKTKGTVLLYHVNQSEEVPYFDDPAQRRAYLEGLQTKYLKKLQRLKRKVVPSRMNVIVSTIVAPPPLEKGLLAFARDNHADLIVMGSQGASGLKKAVLGSHASRMVERSLVPVLIVPEKYQWNEPKTIVFATNYHCNDRPALSFTLSVARIFNAEVTVLHVHDGPDDQNDHAHCFSNYAYFLQRTFNDSPLKFKELKTEHIGQSLEHLSDTFTFDLMVMVRRNKKFLERLFLRNFAKNMACTTRLPLLVIPEEGLE